MQTTVCELRSQAHLRDKNGLKVDFIETVPQLEQFRVREQLRKLAENIFREVIETQVPSQKI